MTLPSVWLYAMRAVCGVFRWCNPSQTKSRSIDGYAVVESRSLSALPETTQRCSVRALRSVSTHCPEMHSNCAACRIGFIPEQGHTIVIPRGEEGPWRELRATGRGVSCLAGETSEDQGGGRCGLQTSEIEIQRGVLVQYSGRFPSGSASEGGVRCVS
jgi:hypothetical protein